MSSSQERQPLLAPAAEGESSSELTLPTPATATTRRRPTSLSVITQLTKRWKESRSNGSNGNGNGRGGLAAQLGLAAAAPGDSGAQGPQETPSLLPAPLSARLLDAGAAFLNAINPLRSPVEPPIPLPDSADRALEGIVSHVVEDFEKIQCIVVRDGIRQVISDALADKTAIVTAHDTFLSNSWKVTDVNMQKLFNLADAMQDTYAGLGKGIQTFYVRSKALEASDLLILRDHFARRYHHPEHLGKLDALSALAEDNTVYLRYIGTVVGPRTPRSRYEDDLSADVGLFAKTDLLIKEMRETGELANESDWTVHEFTSLRTAAAGSTDFRTLFVEKILISLFGRETLINVQPGGYFATYAPTATDVKLFTDINTSVFAHLAALNASPGINAFSGRPIAQHLRLDDIKTHFSNVFTFLKAHPHMVANRDISDTSRIAVDTLQQAIPLTRDICGGTLVLLISKDLPLEALDPKAPDVRFLFDESRAGHIARSTINQLQQNEQAKPSIFVQLLDLLPFVNLYPWLLRHMLARGSVFLAEYMDIVRPWVTVTFSGEVTRTIAKGFTFYGSFEGQGEAGRKTLLEDVGIPFVASFDPSWTENPQASGPADDSHTTTLGGTMMWLTWVSTFVIIEEAHNLLTEYENQAGGKGKGASRSRLDLCRAIEKAANDRISATGLLSALNEAKAALAQYFAAQKASLAPTTPSVITEAKSSRRIKRAIERLAVVKQFPALGPPNSPARAAQAQALWQRRMLPLGRHLPYNGNPAIKQRWLEWVMTRREGVPLIHAALMRACTQQAVSAQEASEVNILARSLGFSAEDLQDKAGFEVAFQDRLEHMRAGRALSDRFQRAQQSRALLRWGMDPQKVLENSEMALEGQKAQVLDRSTGRFFASVDGKPTRFLFKVPPSLIQVTRTPTLRFRPDGIHLQDDNGNDLHILPANRMALMKAQGPALQRVWQRELQAAGGPSAALAVIPPTPPGRPLMKWTAKGDAYKKVAPIAEEDAIWLFREWLDETFPNAANHIDIHWRDPKNPLLQLPTWLAAEYPHHPHCQTWTDLVQNALGLGSASTAFVRGSLIALRGALTITQYNIQVSTKKKLSGKRWHFEGPRPDSALQTRPAPAS
ncbi:hypothetical protein HDU87_003864 [Geranomyces variabilis]|uniref:Uncharacterized protein n=1 Tax=Geranomyces variabilis TaxID=109894 RepID=A0AAD5XMA2_9FUNG|nr:hypothetical protein HDU87_003864 [Geranomyces variabilis]